MSASFPESGESTYCKGFLRSAVAAVTTGTFDADDPQSLQELLGREADLRLRDSGQNIRIESR